MYVSVCSRVCVGPSVRRPAPCPAQGRTTEPPRPGGAASAPRGAESERHKSCIKARLGRLPRHLAGATMAIKGLSRGRRARCLSSRRTYNTFAQIANASLSRSVDKGVPNALSRRAGDPIELII